MFGDVVDTEMKLNDAGRIVAEEWQRSAVIRAEIELDEWVVMPNHVHALVCLTARARQASPLRLGDVIGAFKSGSAREINGLRGRRKVWQRGYHDHVVRDESDLERVRAYIAGNPATWDTDPENVM